MGAGVRLLGLLADLKKPRAGRSTGMMTNRLKGDG
jgi:hypothetical protein